MRTRFIIGLFAFVAISACSPIYYIIGPDDQLHVDDRANIDSGTIHFEHPGLQLLIPADDISWPTPPYANTIQMFRWEGANFGTPTTQVHYTLCLFTGSSCGSDDVNGPDPSAWLREVAIDSPNELFIILPWSNFQGEETHWAVMGCLNGHYLDGGFGCQFSDVRSFRWHPELRMLWPEHNALVTDLDPTTEDAFRWDRFPEYGDTYVHFCISKKPGCARTVGQPSNPGNPADDDYTQYTTVVKNDFVSQNGDFSAPRHVTLDGLNANRPSSVALDFDSDCDGVVYWRIGIQESRPLRLCEAAVANPSCVPGASPPPCRN